MTYIHFWTEEAINIPEKIPDYFGNSQLYAKN